MRLRHLCLRHLCRRLTVTALVVLSALGLATVRPAGAATADEGRVLQLTNQVRASVGAQPLVLDESLSATARRWAAAVAAAGRISHNPDLPRTSSGPTAIAENVVVGPTIEMAHDALVGSPSHHVNLVNPTVSRVGIGVAWAGGMVYVVQNFLIVRGATAPTSTPTTARPPATAPPTTRVPAAPPAATPVPTTTTTVAPPAAAETTPAAVAGRGPSAWLALSFEVLRAWERTSG